MTQFNAGLQRERTAIAWHRAALAMLANAFIVLRAGAYADQTIVVMLGFLLVLLAAAAVACGAWRSHQLAKGGEHTTPWSLMLGSVAGVWFACAAGALAVAMS